MATAKLEYVSKDSSSGAMPFVVHFTNGNLKHNLHEKLNEGIKFACYQWADHAHIRKKHRRTLVAETDEMNYIGENFGEFSRSNTMCKYVLGIYNSNTEVMKMYDTEMITLQPKVLVDADMRERADDQESKPVLSYTEKNDLLTEAFGSGKKKKDMASRLRNKVDKTDLGDKVANVVQAVLIETTLDETDGVHEQHLYIPPFNATAATAAKVYDLDVIITPMEYEVLQKTSVDFQNSNRDRIKEWRSQKRFPEYILRHLEVMSVNCAQRLHQSCCLLYLSYMMTLYSLNYKDLRRKNPLWGMPGVIQERLLSEFSVEKGKFRAVPKRLKDKLLSYILVLALIIDEFTLDCSVIMKDLGMSASRLTSHLKAVGCVVRSSNLKRKRQLDDNQGPPKLIATLGVPLPSGFPNNLAK